MSIPGIVPSPRVTLATAVASPAGTINVAYPSGYVQADFTSGNASANAYVLLNDNDRYEETDDEFDITYDTTYVTITNKSGYTWPVGTVLQIGLARVGTTESYIQAAALADLGGSLTGSVDGDLADVPAIAIDTSDTLTDSAVNTAVNTAITAINLQLKELQTKQNATLARLRSAGVIAT